MNTSMILVFSENQPLVDELSTHFDDLFRVTGTEHPEQLMHSPRMILIDTELTAFQEGSDLIPTFHAQWPGAPIVILAKSSDQKQIVDGLSKGAADFVLTDSLPDLMTTRIKVRLASAAEKESLNKINLTEDLWLDVPKRRLENSEGRIQQLSPIEVSMTQCFLTADNDVISREEIKTTCWHGANVTDNALNRKLHELRKSLLAMNPNISIRTIYGAGFVLEILDSSYQATA